MRYAFIEYTCSSPDANLIRDVSVKNKTEINSVIEPAEGIESIRLRALIDLFDEIIEKPFYDQLRTKEQLGYVQCDWKLISGVFGFYFIVQSSEYNPIYLQRRVDNFMNGLEDILVYI
ncbi:nardilysin-like [Rosa chinensis]|uniref:nardilysin-like n=1 Tax=Rosa chinensis TaxID=74649 RepID=UPI001AD90D1C|nr:nardilysin-like [Rosa chinensis]